LHGASETADVFGGDAVLLEDFAEVGLGDVVDEGAVPEDEGAVSGGVEFLQPGEDALGERLGIGAGDGFVQTGDEHAGSDAVDGLAGDLAQLHGHAEIEAELEQEFEEDVLLGALALEVIHGGFEALGEVFVVRISLLFPHYFFLGKF